VREGLVVARGDFQVQAHRGQVLGQHRADAAGHAARHADATDGPVLQALHAGALGEHDAADLQVEHRLALGIGHLHFGAGARCEAHLQAARGIGRSEESLGPGGVVTVDEHGLGAIDRHRFGICGDAAHAELQLCGFFQRALRDHAAAAGLRADQEAQGREWGIARHADRVLHLREAVEAGLSAIGRDEYGIVLQVRHVTLGGGGAARPHLLGAHHHLQDIEVFQHFGDFCRGQSRENLGHTGAGRLDVHHHAGDFFRIECHHPLGNGRIDGVVRDEPFDHVELAARVAIHFDDLAVLDLDARLRVVRAAHRDQADLGPLLHEPVEVHGPLLENFEAFLSSCHTFSPPASKRLNVERTSLRSSRTSLRSSVPHGRPASAQRTPLRL